MDGEIVAHYGVHNIQIYRLQFSFSDPRGGEDCLILVIGFQVVVLVNLSVPKKSVPHQEGREGRKDGLVQDCENVTMKQCTTNGYLKNIIIVRLMK